MNDVWSKYETAGYDFLSNLASCAVLTTASYYLAACSPVGLAADLVWLATGLVMGSSLSCKINNYICVDTTIGVSLATSNATSGGTYISSSGKNYLVDYSISKYYIAQQMFRFDIFAKRWAEAKYLGYLKNDRFGFDDDYFIKHDADSDIKATDNINKLDQIYINY